MTTEPAHYTLRDLARQLDVPESTVCYYRDIYGAYLPTVGTGRRRLYPPLALDMLSVIADGYARDLSREQIETALSDVLADGGNAAPVPVQVDQRPAYPLAHADLLATVLDGERERREVMWQLAKEIVRLGEAIERQHHILSEVARRMDDPPRPSLPAASAGSRGDGDYAATRQKLDHEMDALREELERERDLVERLRRSKLAIEHRAADAEAQLRSTTSTQRHGLLERLLARREGQSPP